MKRNYEIKVGGIDFHLRLDHKACKTLTAKYGERPVSIILGAIEDDDRMMDVLRLSLCCNAMDNKIKDPEEFYDMLVDDGKAGELDFAEILLGIAKESGLISSKNHDKLLDDLRNYDEGVTEAEDPTNPQTSQYQLQQTS